MSTTILVPLDGSGLAERVLPHAQALADLTHGRLVLVRAALAHPHPGEDAGQAREAALRGAAEYLAALAKRLSGSSHDVVTAARYGDAAEVIADTARENAADLIVMSTHGRSGLGRWLFGSVADRVHRQAAAPVLLVPAAGARAWVPGTARQILVPLDGSAQGEAAALQAAALARRLDAQLLLLQVVAPPYGATGYEGSPAGTADPDTEVSAALDYLEQQARPLRASGLMVQTRVEVGSPVAAIGAVADEQEVMLLVLGGSSIDALQRANAPVLVVHPPAALAPQPHTQFTIALQPAEIALLERGLRALLADGPEEGARPLLARLEAASSGATLPG